MFFLALPSKIDSRKNDKVYLRKNAKVSVSSHRLVSNYKILLDQSSFLHNFSEPLHLIFLWRWNEQALYWEPGNLFSKPNYI